MSCVALGALLTVKAKTLKVHSFDNDSLILLFFFFPPKKEKTHDGGESQAEPSYHFHLTGNRICHLIFLFRLRSILSIFPKDPEAFRHIGEQPFHMFSLPMYKSVKAPSDVLVLFTDSQSKRYSAQHIGPPK